MGHPPGPADVRVVSEIAGLVTRLQYGKTSSVVVSPVQNALFEENVKSF